MERHPAEAEQHVAGVDRLGDAVERPDGRPVAALAVAVLDVVVDEAEVVAELDGRRAGQGRPVVAGDRGVGEEAEERAASACRGRTSSRRGRGGSGSSRTRRRSTDRGRRRRAGSPPPCRRSGRRRRGPAGSWSSRGHGSGNSAIMLAASSLLRGRRQLRCCHPSPWRSPGSSMPSVGNVPERRSRPAVRAHTTARRSSDTEPTR